MKKLKTYNAEASILSDHTFGWSEPFNLGEVKAASIEEAKRIFVERLVAKFVVTLDVIEGDLEEIGSGKFAEACIDLNIERPAPECSEIHERTGYDS